MVKSSIFRDKALQRLDSPEQLNQRLKVLSFKSWLLLSCFGVMVGAGLLWSIFGRIPITVEGRGILIRSRAAVGVPLETGEFQAQGSGQLVELRVREGDRVRKGDLLAVIDQPELRQQLQHKQEELARLQGQAQTVGSLEAQEANLNKLTIQVQRQNIHKQIQELQQRAKVLQAESSTGLQKQRQSYQEQLQRAITRSVILKQALEKRQLLKKQNLISDSILLDAEQAYSDSLNQISNLRTQLQQLKVEEAKTKDSYLQTLSEVSELRGQLKDLDAKEDNLTLQPLKLATDRDNQIAAVRQEINQLKLNLQQKSQIVSKYNGQVLAMYVNVGQLLAEGSSLGMMKVIGGRPTPLSSLVYFTIAGGKQVEPGMKIAITPDTVKREQYGGLSGVVKSVSDYPVSPKSAMEFTGEEAVAQQLTANGGVIEVFAELQPDRDSFSGYQWTASRGPNLKMTSGTTTTALVTVEERAPITFLLPILREWTGIH